MKNWLQIFLLLLLAGCASSYRPVYTSSEGDYYIEEQAVSGSYYGAGSLMYAHTGFYPWWVGMYHPHAFFYYSPYFYPYFFSVYYPPGYYPFYDYGYYRGYYARWHPPHRVRWNHQRGVTGGVMINPLSVAPAYDDLMRARPDSWRPVEDRGTRYSTYAPGSPVTSYRRARANPYAPARRTGSGRPSASPSLSPRSVSTGRSVKNSSRIVVRDKQ